MMLTPLLPLHRQLPLQLFIPPLLLKGVPQQPRDPPSPTHQLIGEETLPPHLKGDHVAPVLQAVGVKQHLLVPFGVGGVWGDVGAVVDGAQASDYVGVKGAGVAAGAAQLPGALDLVCCGGVVEGGGWRVGRSKSSGSVRAPGSVRAWRGCARQWHSRLPRVKDGICYPSVT